MCEEIKDFWVSLEGLRSQIWFLSVLSPAVLPPLRFFFRLQICVFPSLSSSFGFSFFVCCVEGGCRDGVWSGGFGEVWNWSRRQFVGAFVVCYRFWTLPLLGLAANF
ncbi:unnamed protein product [Arabis nemorensis]|uniref:Uncharacterized protein n=1 Tax=Arabis nemorensis TaxID=586526 RepID=A0A565AZR1_9BRAS|nr:unnamed protein product [Arabis nemorensis]